METVVKPNGLIKEGLINIITSLNVININISVILIILLIVLCIQFVFMKKNHNTMMKNR